MSSHPTMGPYLGVWRSWATDPEVRWAGSSGGVLTALSAWLIDSGRAARSTGARSAANPRRSVPVTITTKRDALAAAGSRYTPVAGLANADVLRSDTAVTCKPCEASALSTLAPLLSTDGSETPIILSFFCAGTPSAHATDALLAELDVSPVDAVDELWYRGRGWPGRFTAASRGRTVSADYDTSWGKTLGPTTQWRCKVCPDGVGESADVVAADYWRVDSRGYPEFTDGDGDGALIARTPRGLAIIEAAVDAGVIHVEPVPMATLAAVQPLQDKRRRLLAARTLGSLLAGRAVPRYRGFGLISLSVAQPRRALEAARGTFRRVRRSAPRSSAARRPL
ncbi:Coenzyme F420 hydrogenase/dehydrogenase, beta subunit C-terminal domain [Marisediminicola sp. LYQ85]|uniref:Coenzyme F420 hydrogenase/dehydrogenase, beta subunit C-terminal domain n=1 Tax=Marisediminicola sp. LYQ85 TaxID=3391062 RepID=UPI003983964D